MPVPIEEIVAGVIAPLLIASIVYGACLRLARFDPASRYAAALALASGFCTAFLFFTWAPLRPNEHWHWLPYLAVIAMIVGPASIATGVRRFERYALYLVVAAIAAFCLVPDWKSLETTRHWHRLIVGFGIALPCILLEELAKRRHGSLLPLSLFATCLAGSVVLVLSGSLKFAQLAGAVSFSLLGCSLVSLRSTKDAAFRGLMLAYTVLLGGLMYIARIHSFSQVPVASYILVLVAPIALWLAVVGPAARLPRRWQVVAQVAVVLIPLAIGVGLAAMQS